MVRLDAQKGVCPFFTIFRVWKPPINYLTLPTRVYDAWTALRGSVLTISSPTKAYGFRYDRDMYPTYMGELNCVIEFKVLTCIKEADQECLNSN